MFSTNGRGEIEIDAEKAKKWGKRALTGLFAFVGSCTAFNSVHTIVPPKNFGVRIQGGVLQDKILSPNFYWQYPIYDDIYTFKNNTIILENIIGSGNNTKDQNSFSAEMRVHYKISPNAGILAFHINEMGDDNGQTLVTEQMDKAMNAVVGQRTSPETLVAPPEVLDAFVEQLQWRLKQNNVAVEIETVEFLTANVGGLRLPVQLKKVPGKPVKSMAGPSVPVQHLKITVAGNEPDKSPAKAPVNVPAATPAAP